VEYNSKNLAASIPPPTLNPPYMAFAIKTFCIRHPGLLFLLPYSALLIFLGLGDGALQVDEGMDTFVSTTILKFGVPMHSDGTNATMLFADIFDGLFLYRTWVPYYLQVLSLSVLGQTTVAARLPFAFVGLISVIAIYFLALRLTASKFTAFLSALFLASSVPALIYFRTARYVGFSILLTILLIYFYIQIFEDKKWKSSPFTIVAILFFHSMYVAFAGIVLGILIHFLLHRKKIRSENAKRVPRCAMIIACFTLPWLMAISPVFSHIAQFYTSTSNLVDTSFTGYFKHFLGYLFQTNNYIFPFIFLPFLFLKKLHPYKLQIQLLTICIVSHLVVSSTHAIPLYQYVAGVIPLLFILLAMVVTMSFQKGFWPPALLSGILIFTNILHTGPLFPVKKYLQNQEDGFGSSPYLQYASFTFMRETQLSSVFYKHLYQISHPYQGPLDKVLEFFKTHGNSSQTCYIDNESESLAFYTGIQVIAGNALDLKSPPDWIVLRGDHRNLSQADPVTTILNTIIESNPYREILLDIPAIRINNSYEIQIHQFRSPESTERVIIYQRMDRPSSNL
jgi:dolichyl-phosphate-mannose-protein mannosyltransferase